MIDVRRLRRRLIIHATVGAFLVGILAAGLTVGAFSGRLAEAVSDVASSAGRASASAIYEVVNGQRKVAHQITSRTRARVVLGQFVRGDITADSFAEQTARILSDALGGGEDVAGIIRVPVTGGPVSVGESPPKHLWPPAWDKTETVQVWGPRQTPTGLRLLLAAPVAGADGRRLGVDILTLPLDEIAARLGVTKTKAGGTTRVYLLYGDSPEPQVLQADGSVKALSRQLGPAADAIRTASVEVDEAIQFFAGGLLINVAAVGIGDWRIVVTQTTDQVFAGLIRQLAWVTVAVLFLTALGAGGVYLLLRPVTGTLMVHADTLSKEVERRSEALQKANENLARADRMASLGNMVAGVAHEINTPVGTIITGASHLADETEKLKRLYRDDDLSMEELDAFLAANEEATRLILSNAGRAAELIHSFKQVAVDRAAGERRTFALKEYLGEILLSLRPQIKKRPISVVVEGPDEVTLDSYPGALSQIFTNLIMNSLFHGFDEQQEGRITISFTPAGNHVEIIYSDSGRGIPEEYRQRIFDPFFTTRRSSGGSGLGLNIVFNLVSNTLGGTITLAEAKKPGATFVIDIPSCAPQPKSAAP